MVNAREISALKYKEIEFNTKGAALAFIKVHNIIPQKFGHQDSFLLYLKQAKIDDDQNKLGQLMNLEAVVRAQAELELRLKDIKKGRKPRSKYFGITEKEFVERRLNEKVNNRLRQYYIRQKRLYNIKSCIPRGNPSQKKLDAYYKIVDVQNIMNYIREKPAWTDEELVYLEYDTNYIGDTRSVDNRLIAFEQDDKNSLVDRLSAILLIED